MRIIAGVRSPGVSTGTLEGLSCSTTASLDWFAILDFRGDGRVGEDEEYEEEETLTGSGTGEDGAVGGTAGREFGRALVTATVTASASATATATARLLLRVGSEEATDGVVRDS